MTKYIVKQTVIVYNSIFSMEIKPERKPKDFSNDGKIYCIRNTIDDNIYVGCTCQSLSKRMAYLQDPGTSFKHHVCRYFVDLKDVLMEFLTFCARPVLDVLSF